MADPRIELPADLRALVARDLVPVAGLAPPARRAVGVVPIAVALLVASVAVFGLRRDASQLGLLLTWGRQPFS